MKKIPNIEISLKKAPPEVRQFVACLKQLNKRLQKEGVALEADKVSDRHKIAALKKRLSDELKKENLTIKLAKFKEKPSAQG